MSKAVIRIDLRTKEVKEYPSTAEAARDNYCSRPAISHYCSGKRNPSKLFGHYRFIWKSKEDA